MCKHLVLWGFIVSLSIIKRQQQYLWHFECKAQELENLYQVEISPSHCLGFPVLEEHRVGGAYVLLVVVVTDNLYIIETELDFDTLIGRGEETESVEGKLELGTDADEDAALGLYTGLPAEL